MIALFAIRILVSTIWEMVHGMSGTGKDLNSDHRFSADLISWPHLPGSYHPVACLMVEYGWCSHEILRLLGTYNLTTAWCIARIHGHCTPATLHQRCDSAPKCIARVINLGSYHPTHLLETCDCEEIGPDMQQVKQVIEEGAIPLIRCTVTGSSQVTFEVVHATRPRRHIAFSHVWADGIVIPQSNKVYKCQMLMMLDYVKKAWPQLLGDRLWLLPFNNTIARRFSRRKRTFDIWFDIFCIPAGADAASMQIRKQAIGRIYPVFAGAESVLVFDKSLLKHDTASTSIVQTMARIVSSNWMRRCWTFAEASLAAQSKLQFCTRDSLVQYADINLADKSNAVFRAQDTVSQGIFRDLVGSALAAFQIARVASQPVLSDTVAFAYVWNELTSRSTSWPDDVWGIMATLIGFSGSEIMSIPEGERLPALLKSCSCIPTSFLFRNLPRSPAAQATRRWIPTSIQGRIRSVDSFLAFREGGIVIGKGYKMKLSFFVDYALPSSFSITFSSRLTGIRVTFHITLHNSQASAQNVSIGDHLCVILSHRKAGAGGFGAATHHTAGVGCLLKVKRVRQNAIVEADFMTSLDFDARDQSNPNTAHFDAFFTGPIVILSCDRDDWYQLKTRRQKNKISPTTMSRLLYTYVPVAYFMIFFVVIIPLWVREYYRKGNGNKLLVASLVVPICVLPYMYVVLFHEGWLFRNWVDSFMQEDGPKPWYRRIMPFF